MTHDEFVPVRDAATVVLVRDAPRRPAGSGPAVPNRPDGRAPSTLEVLMLTRREESLFTQGAWVFPGGRVDPHDRAAADHPVADDRSDADASRLMGVDRHGLAFWVAAARECFEEAGILLARGPGGRPPSLAEHEVAARYADLRAAVEAEQVPFVDVLEREGLVLDLASMHYFAHWITPVGPPRRYDTRFFVAPAPPDQPASPDGTEAVACQWVQPRAVLRRAEAGEVDLIFPTARTLETLAGFSSAAALLAGVRAAEEAAGDDRPVPVVADHSGRRVALAVDPDDESTTGVLASAAGSRRGGDGV